MAESAAVPDPVKLAAPIKPAALVKLVSLKIDGREVQVPAGTSIIQATHDLGIDVPVFCYHPGLPVAGNCRMCMVEASNSKKPVTACTTPVAEGIEVRTQSEMAVKARAGVLELMLLNHPLDCPVCDKSGECLLQDNSYSHGRGKSRMVEEKVLKHTKALGPSIWIWGNRCIVCTRCTRFCDEVAGTSELCVIERGDRSVIDILAGHPLENPLAGNTVDLCPVGALISKDFLYQARVWNTTKTETICTGCARGCNIEVQCIENRIHRLVPRENRAVNDWWMCDHGRFDYKYVESSERRLDLRLIDPTAPAAQPLQAAPGKFIAENLSGIARRHGSRAVAGLGSSFLTLEELHLLKKLFATLGSGRLGALACPDGKEERFKRGFIISADKNPNREGARRVLGADCFDNGLEDVLTGIHRGEVRGLLAVSNLPHSPLDARLVQLLGKLEFAVVFLLEEDARVPAAISLLPATTFAEKDGAMINDRGRVQRLRPATALPRTVRTEIDILQEALIVLGERRHALSAAGLFREIGREEIPELKDRSYRDLGSQGIDLSLSPATGASAGAAPQTAPASPAASPVAAAKVRG